MRRKIQSSAADGCRGKNDILPFGWFQVSGFSRSLTDKAGVSLHWLGCPALAAWPASPVRTALLGRVGSIESAGQAFLQHCRYLST